MENKTPTNRLEELQKGCGNKLYDALYNLCGNFNIKNEILLCPTCQAELKGLIFAKEFYEKPKSELIQQAEVCFPQNEAGNNMLKAIIKRGEEKGYNKAKQEFENKQKEFVEKLKEKWRIKSREMELMSGEVAIFELESEIDKLAGEIFK